MQVRPLNRAALVAVVTTALLSVLPLMTGPAHAVTGYGQGLVDGLNRERAAHGLPALRLAAGTTEVAQGWAAHLAAAQQLSHRPDLAQQLAAHGSTGWHAISENVGYDAAGSSADHMVAMYMNSPAHRANILDPHVRFVGVGVVGTGALSWNTLDFVDVYAATPTAPAPAPTTAPPALKAPPAVKAPPVVKAPTVVRTPVRSPVRAVVKAAPPKAPATRPAILVRAPAVAAVSRSTRSAPVFIAPFVSRLNPRFVEGPTDF